MDDKQPIDIDDDGKPFDLDTYFAKAGLTKPERRSPERFDLLRKKFAAGAIAHSGQSVLDIRPASEWMLRDEASVKPPGKLFGDFWLQGELCILFADTAKGKSILAVQIAESIARGRPVKPFEMTAKPQRVLYLDFELDQVQFTRRYAGSADINRGRVRDRKFHTNFDRAAIKSIEVPPAFRDVGEFLAHSIRNAVTEREARVLIIDNISWLRTSNTNASAALELMRELKALKNEFGISILVLAHTPKRPFARALTVNDLAGSKMLANFADSIFAIGDSIKGNNVRYLKQIKPRSTPLIYDATHVAVARIEKPSNFLKFTFTGFANEAEHLIRTHYRLDGCDGPTSASDAETLESASFRKKLIANCRDLHEKGLSTRQIAAQFGIGATTVRRYLADSCGNAALRK